MKVLFLDDEQAILNALGRSLRDEGFELFFTDDPRSALRIVADNSVDVIVADNRMPGVQGIDVLADVHRQHPRVVRVLMTACVDLKTALVAVNECRVAHILLKPWGAELRTLLHRVERELAAERAVAPNAAAALKTFAHSAPRP